jgi:hypothetical protein
MVQRKLTREELQHVDRAAWYLRCVMNRCGLIASGDSVLDHLSAIEAHGTTDGKPYVEPQPEVGDGYRPATEADAWRKDVEYFSNLKGNGWFPRAVHGKPLESSYHYRVPIDRIPTDEDAKQRPTVMVRDDGDKKWWPVKLLGVRDKYSPFVAIYESGALNAWKYARFPYPGELD